MAVTSAAGINILEMMVDAKEVREEREAMESDGKERYEEEEEGPR